jgi:hypothetical protein
LELAPKMVIVREVAQHKLISTIKVAIKLVQLHPELMMLASTSVPMVILSLTVYVKTMFNNANQVNFSILKTQYVSNVNIHALNVN